MTKKFYGMFSTLFVCLSIVSAIWNERTVIPCGLAAIAYAILSLDF